MFCVFEHASHQVFKYRYKKSGDICRKCIPSNRMDHSFYKKDLESDRAKFEKMSRVKNYWP